MFKKGKLHFDYELWLPLFLAGILIPGVFLEPCKYKEGGVCELAKTVMADVDKSPLYLVAYIVVWAGGSLLITSSKKPPAQRSKGILVYGLWATMLISLLAFALA